MTDSDQKKMSPLSSLGSERGCVADGQSLAKQQSYRLAGKAEGRTRRPHRIRDRLQTPEPREDWGWGGGNGGLGRDQLTPWKLGPESRGRAKAPGLPR